MEKKALMISRHGYTEKRPGDSNEDQSLTSESIGRMYNQAKEAMYGFAKKNGVTPTSGKSSFWHSGKQRTFHTAATRILGAKGYEPIPQSQEHIAGIENLVRSGNVHTLLAFDDLKLNEDAYTTEGDAKYVTKWVGDPNKNAYDGVPITPFNEAMRSRASCLYDAIRSLINEDKALKVLGTHSGVTEALLAAAVNSGRDQVPVDHIDAIGGPVKKEDFAVVYIDGTQAKLVRGDFEAPMDLNALRAIAGR